MIETLRILLIASCAGALLTACGGSSGGAPAPGPIESGGDPVAITLDNADQTAAVVAGVALGDGVFGAISDLQLPSVPGVTGVVVDGAAKLARSVQVSETKSELFDCAQGGSVDIDITVDNPLQPTEGDIYALQFMECDDGDGIVTNGGMIMTITGLDGDFASGNFLLGVRMQLSAFSVTEGGQTTGAEGSVSVSIDTRTPPVTTITVTTAGLATSSATTAEVVTDLTVTISEDESMFPTGVSVDTSFTIDSPRIGGEVSVSTTLALQASGEEYPYVGELRISGAGNSVVVLIALDANLVRLEIDVDGDGALDGTEEMTWDELMALGG